jgi:hypothetical protein
MLYKKAKSPKISVAVAAVTGANVRVASKAAAVSPVFYPWQPSTWPPAPAKCDRAFIKNLKQIFHESILGEIENVIGDIQKSNGDLQHRGHVVAISLLCALDSIASYPYRGNHVLKFVQAHFPAAYKPHGEALYLPYRNCMIHKWNLFEASLLPGNEAVTVTASGSLCFGLLDFQQALRSAVADFLRQLETVPELQQNTLNTYSKLRRTAKT